MCAVQDDGDETELDLSEDWRQAGMYYVRIIRSTCHLLGDALDNQKHVTTLESDLDFADDIKGILNLWTLVLKTLCRPIFLNNRATLDKVSNGSN